MLNRSLKIPAEGISTIDFPFNGFQISSGAMNVFEILDIWFTVLLLSVSDLVSVCVCVCVCVCV